MLRHRLVAFIYTLRGQKWRARLQRLGGAIIVVGSAYIFVRAYSNWTDPDREFKLINFAAAWFPFAISVFAAFIPDLEKAERMRPVWRVGIIFIGLFYSAVLWKQQSVNLTASRKDQQEAVTKAVDKSNQHTDQLVENANEHNDKEVEKVRDDVKQTGQHSDEQVNGVRKDLRDLATFISQVQDGLNLSISKVGKPDPLPPAVLQFSLWSSNQSDPFPLIAKAIQPDKDGVFTIEFSALNKSQTAARSVDVWLDICQECTFAKEPVRFDRPEGMRDQTRHIMLNLLNPNTSMGKETVAVKFDKKPSVSIFQIGFRYSCEACGSPSEQLFNIVMLPPLDDK